MSFLPKVMYDYLFFGFVIAAVLHKFMYFKSHYSEGSVHIIITITQ